MRIAIACLLLAPTIVWGQTIRPNVLFIMSDDLGAYLGCYGSPVKSPNIDKLAARGVRFDRAYCQYPLCGPTRCSLMSGLRPDSSGVITNGPTVRDKVKDVVTLPQLFRENGYTSLRVGKIYHLGIPGDVGKPGPDDAASWNTSFNPKGNEFPSDDDGEMVDPNPKNGQSFRYNMLKGDGSDQADSQSADVAIRLLNEYKDKPFFLALGFIRPHVPLVAPKTYFDLYPIDQIKPFSPADDLRDIPKAAIQHSNLDMGMTPQQCIESLRAYHAATSFMDAQVGRVLDELEKLGLSDKTIVVLVGDHGYALGQHREWQKMQLFEPVCRVPMIIAAPGMKPAATTSLVESVDLYPTVCALAGLRGPKALEGTSLVPVMKDPSAKVKSAAFTQVQRVARKVQGRTVRTDRWRYTEWTGEGGGVELYDEENDPGELKNLASDPQHADIVAELKKLLAAGYAGV